MRILGIDPGSRITGFGVIEQTNNKYRYIASGSIKVKQELLADKLKEIYEGVLAVSLEYKPDVVAIEQVFVHKNVSSALKLGQARGVAIVAAASAGLEVAEYAPRQIKQAVVGYGGADKTQIQHMVSVLLSLSSTPQADAADALAIAICHSHFDKQRILV